MDYQCVPTSVGGFVQQLAVQYVAWGYRLYVPGEIPVGKDPRVVDEKLIDLYGIGVSSSKRARRRAAGFANIQYLRFNRSFILVATEGRHRFSEWEQGALRDLSREQPFFFRGYSIAYRGGHASVRIERDAEKRLRAWFLKRALTLDLVRLERAFRSIRFEPYAPVRSQLIALLGKVNKTRRRAGLAEVPLSALRLKRKIFRPFEEKPGVRQ